MGYETLRVEELENGTIVRVTLCRPKVRNAINLTLF
jgi:enoyl-CoA hydratase/carnithine racemase